MSLYAIADLHLSLGTDKPMDIFSGWDNYVERLESNWKKLITDNDTVVIPGDISWAMKIDECYNDFEFINNLPGKKIFGKGNHDYWWATKSKIDNFLKEHNFDTISVLFNNSYLVDNISICGTRGWFIESESDEDVKVLGRELGRLKTSLDCAVKLGGTPTVFLHYPPVYGNQECSEIIEMLNEYNIKNCYYGHIHGSKNAKNAVEGIYKGINFHLVSCDKLGFMPFLVR
ncbi:MAG: metallophosphoesterase [Ruminococcus sp.]|nr:metallophosphoesterase [Ruminococcus sp.]